MTLLQKFGLESFRNRLLLVLGSMFLVTLSYTAYNQFMINKFMKEKSNLVSFIAPARDAALQLSNKMYLSSQHLNNYVDEGNEADVSDWQYLWNQEIYPLFQAVGNASKIYEDEEFARNLRKFEILSKEIQNLQQASLDKARRTLKERSFYTLKSRSGLLYFEEENGDTFKELEKSQKIIFANINNDISPKIKEAGNLSHSLYLQLEGFHASEEAYLMGLINHLQSAGFLGAILSLLVAIFGLVFYSKNLFVNIRNLALTVKEMADGNIPNTVTPEKNESAMVSNELNRLIENLQKMRAYSLQVGQGQFDNHLDIFNNKGDLGGSLAHMRESLSKVAKEDRQRNWVNEGFASFSEIIRKNGDNIGHLCDEIIGNLVKYLGASQGIIFILRKENSEDYLEAIGCYAFNKKKAMEKRVYMGEGIVGQAWQENDLLLVNDIPDEYIHIRSGLGDSSPKNILVAPLIFNEEVVGALELASFKPLEEYQVKFVAKLCESIASSIFTTQNNEKTSNLLEETQQMAEMMRAQEEEMRQNMEEMQATQDEMHRTQAEIKRKEYNLNALINNTADTIFAIDTKYNITVVNQTLVNKYKNFGIELKVGQNIFDLLPKDKRDFWKERYDRAMLGERYTIIEETSGSNGEKYSQTFHNPIRNEFGNIIGVSVISRDVTELVKAQQEVARKTSVMHSLIDNTNDTFFAIDTHYRILVANKALKERFLKTNIVLEEGDNIFDKLPADQRQVWKERYDRALLGESFMIPQERKVNDETLFIEGYYNPIKNEKGEVIGASVMSRDVTEWKRAIDEKALRESEIEKLKTAMGMPDVASLEELIRRQAQQDREIQKRVKESK